MATQLANDLFQNFVHIGHRTQKWNPKMKKYLYGELDGYHIINLEKTIDLLDIALQFLSKTSGEGKTILFVSTKPQSMNLIKNVAQSCNMPYVASKWIPGLITNYSTVKTRIKYLSDLKEQAASGELDKYTKKEASQLKKNIAKLQIALGGVQKMTKAPDVVFVLDPVRDDIVVKEANKSKIPVVAFTDSNADPDLIDYPIPANDDALKALDFMLDKIAEAVKKPNKASK
ncbi:30S ribosomal protein S2 [Candidatus Peregrinibacteria bacterium]|nr:30S ribosomal protein S2 [Candidatus Peregrinibacteria bacterium]